ncbi:hypothetical protein P0Y35_00625 [Kiritimatiellaeota bacterium B1221]|nr:hypothetical protein [Kiritimatiellaeota bacterium B1221]
MKNIPSLPAKENLSDFIAYAPLLADGEIRVSIHLGCRSMKYNLDAFIRNSSGQRSFLLTHYDGSPGFQFSRAVDLLCQSLEKRQNVEILKESREQLYTARLLLGRSRQWVKFPEETHLPKSLFRWVGSEQF